jgi:hypothetical protein
MAASAQATRDSLYPFFAAFALGGRMLSGFNDP